VTARTNRKSKERKLRRGRVDEATRIALVILPAGQAYPGTFEAVDVVNHSEADHRAMVRSMGANMLNPDARRTVRRKPKLHTQHILNLLSARELAACEWYAQAHSLRYDTIGVTVRYGAVGGRSGNNFDHLPKTREQIEAYINFEWARAGINPFMLGLFERVVLHGRPLGKLGITFRTAARQLLERIEGRVNI
jgi:hypothetical protein